MEDGSEDKQMDALLAASVTSEIHEQTNKLHGP
jgi:hypothetical protein